MASLKQIEDFFAAEPIAIVGVSRNPKKFGQIAFKELKERGLKVIPVNPAAEEILGDKAYPNIAALPVEVRGVILMTKKEQTAAVVKEAIEKRIKNIWIQQNTDSNEALKELEGTDINFIRGECVLMHYKPRSVHKFHKTLKKLFGRFPR